LVPSELDLDSPEPPDAVSIDDGDILDALASVTARRIVCRLREGPAVKSELAAKADVSIQVVSYHLDRLEAAGLVAVVGTTYSEKGREMDVYAVTTDSIVVELCGES
jgi:DNA-binding transcriptional ArsR family regulator